MNTEFKVIAYLEIENESVKIVEIEKDDCYIVIGIYKDKTNYRTTTHSLKSAIETYHRIIDHVLNRMPKEVKP